MSIAPIRSVLRVLGLLGHPGTVRADRPIFFRPIVVLLAAATACVCVAPAAAQTTVSFGAQKDNTLYEDTQGDVSNGMGSHMFVGRTSGNVEPGGPSGFKRRAVIKFDLSSIPAGSTITNVVLTLHLSKASQVANSTIGVHRLQADWGEGTSNGANEEGRAAPAATNDATWQHRFYSATQWTNPGATGQFINTASDTTSVGAAPAFITWTSNTMETDVAGWVNSPATNFGWLLKGNEDDVATTKRFDTRNNGTAANRPELEVTYIAPTGACCENGVCAVMTQAACTSSGGTYQGNGTDCSPNPCPAATGACCTNDVCSVTTQTNCVNGGGTYLGNGTDCTPDPCAAGTQVVFAASKDNTLYETPTGTQSNGAGSTMTAGTGATGSDRRRALVAFNVASIPANATITSATLRLFQDFTPDTQSRTFIITPMLQNWGEGTSNAVGNELVGAAPTSNDATWVHAFFPGTNWTNAGGTFNIAVASAVASAGTTNAFVEWTGPNVAADVQNWVTNPATNFGWMVKLSLIGEFSLNSQHRFASRTHPTQAVRPILTIRYTVPPPTGACCATDGSCTVLEQADCLAAGGIYSGDGSNCSPNLCPQPTGACCFNSGNCNTLTQAACDSTGGNYQGNFTDCANAVCPVILTPFVDALPIPAVMQPVSGVPFGSGNYVVNITEFYHQYHSELPETRVWGYNGSTPGPTFQTTRGFPITVTWVNDLRTTRNTLRTTHLLPVDTCLHGPDVTGEVPVTVTHFHGGKVDPVSDGNPDDAFPPGQSSPLYFYPNDQRACSLWYHDHALGITRLNVMMGLAGAYLIHDEQEAALNLPTGEFDIPLIIQDRSFNPDGSVKYNQTFTDNFFGEFAMVNGKVWPYLDVKQGKYRFRLVNGSNTRVYTLGLSNNQTFHQIASEQGLLPSPVAMTSITIAPGERAEIVVNFVPSPTAPLLGLVNTAAAPFPVGDPAKELPFIMQFRINAMIGDQDPIPNVLVPVPQIPEAEATVSRSFTLRNVNDPECSHGLWLINDLMWDDVTDFPRIGSTEIWQFVNRSNLSHPMHIHLVSFQILDRQDFTVVNNVPVASGPRIPPLPGEAGWKDTVLAHPNQFTRVIMRFEGFSGHYPFHCHILEHEDHEMMRMFEVICDPPVITGQPTNVTVAPGGNASFSVTATGDVLEYQWQNFNGTLTDGVNPNGTIISGSGTPNLTLTNVHADDAGRYSCRIFNPCGNTVSASGQLFVVECPQDFNNDGILSPDDLDEFITTYFSDPPDNSAADFNNDGIVSPDDLDEYITAYFEGC